MYKLVHRVKSVLHAILLSHYTDISQQVWTSSLQFRFGWHRLQAFQIWPVAYHENPGRRAVTAFGSNPFLRKIAHDYLVSYPVGAPFKKEKQLVNELSAPLARRQLAIMKFN